MVWKHIQHMEPKPVCFAVLRRIFGNEKSLTGFNSQFYAL